MSTKYGDWSGEVKRAKKQFQLESILEVSSKYAPNCQHTTQEKHKKRLILSVLCLL